MASHYHGCKALKSIHKKLMHLKIDKFSFLLILIASNTYANTQGEKDNTQGESLEEIYQRVFGEPMAIIPPQAEVELRINGLAVGSITIRSDRNNINQINKSKLFPILKSYLKEKHYDLLEKLAINSQWISRSQLEDAEINISYNTMELSADLIIKKSLMNRRMRSLGNTNTGNVIPENLLAPAKTSAYINLRSSVSHDHQATSQPTHIDLQAETVLNVGGMVLENQFTLRPIDRAQRKVTRDYTRVVVDDVENEHRYKVGDITTEGHNFQNSLSLGGMQLSHDTLWASPQEYQPQSDFSFTLSNDSTVEVYQNGVTTPLRTAQLPAGEHKLSELGINTHTPVTLRIHDAFGQITEREFTRFTDSRLLSPELSRYALSVGVPANRDANGIQYDKKRRLISGFYQQGLTDILTVGTDFQTDGKAHQTGVEAIMATPVGNITAGTSQTRTSKGKKGQANRLQISRPQLSTSEPQNPIDWEISTEHYSPGYQAVYSSTEDSPQALRSQWNVRASYSLNDRLHVSTNLAQMRYYNQPGNTQQASISINKRVGKNTNLSLSANHSKGINLNQGDKHFQIGLSIPLDSPPSSRSKTISTSYNSNDKSQNWNYHIAAKGSHGKDSLNGSLQVTQREDKTAIGGDIRFQVNQFDLNASHRQIINDKKIASYSNVNINTALVMADGEWAVSRPVYDSFAILHPPEGMQKPLAASRGKNVFNRTSDAPDALPDQFDVLLKPKRKAVLPNFGSYRVQHISADSSALPEGFNPDATEFDVLPDYRSGYNVKLGGEKGLTLNVHFTDRGGNPITNQGGQLVPLNPDKPVRPTLFFTDEMGDTYIQYIQEGRYEVEFFSLPSARKTVLAVKGDRNTPPQPVSINAVVNTAQHSP